MTRSAEKREREAYPLHDLVHRGLPVPQPLLGVRLPALPGEIELLETEVDPADLLLHREDAVEMALEDANHLAGRGVELRVEDGEDRLALALRFGLGWLGRRRGRGRGEERGWEESGMRGGGGSGRAQAVGGGKRGERVDEIGEVGVVHARRGHQAGVYMFGLRLGRREGDTLMGRFREDIAGGGVA